MAKAPEPTPISEWTVPNQSLIEAVIDARIEKHLAEEQAEKTEKRTASARSRTAASKDADES